MQSRRSAESKQERKQQRQARSAPAPAGAGGKGSGKAAPPSPAHTPEALIQHASSALAAFQPELALKFFQRAQALAPDDTNIMDATADCLLQLGEPEDALRLGLGSGLGLVRVRVRVRVS